MDYDLWFTILLQVDTHIQQLDQYLKKFDEELRRGTTFSVSLIIQILFVWISTILFWFMSERENAAIAGVPSSGPDATTKSGRGESGRGGRKKYVISKS